MKKVENGRILGTDAPFRDRYETFGNRQKVCNGGEDVVDRITKRSVVMKFGVDTDLMIDGLAKEFTVCFIPGPLRKKL